MSQGSPTPLTLDQALAKVRQEADALEQSSQEGSVKDVAQLARRYANKIDYDSHYMDVYDAQDDVRSALDSMIDDDRIRPLYQAVGQLIESFGLAIEGVVQEMRQALDQPLPSQSM